MQYLKNIALCAFFLCYFTAVSLAQSGDAAVTVIIKDQFDGVISDAEIKLLKAEEKEKTFKSNQQGVAQLSRIAVGEYRVVVSAAGFKEYKSESFALGRGERKRIEILLEVAPVESNVEITNDDQVDPERQGLTTTLNEREIDNLPDDPQELEKKLKRIGEAVSGEDLPITVNGVQGAKVPPKQAIQQIRVNQNVFSAQFDSPAGSGIEIFTRASVTKYGGYFGFNFADSRLNAADPFLGGRVPFQSKNFNGNINGPLGKKANFLLSVNRGMTDSSAVINATILDSALRPVQFRQSFATPNRYNNLYSVINADPNKKHKIYLNYSFYSGSSEGQSVGGFSLPNRANSTESKNHYVQFSDTYLANQNIVNQTRFLTSYGTNKTFSDSAETALNVLDAFSGGGSQQNISSRNIRAEAYNDTTWQMGRYTLGFGTRLRAQYTKQISSSNFGGTYTFGGRLAPVLDAANNPVRDVAGNVITDQISSLESYRRTLLLSQLGYSNQRIRELGGGASQFTISGGNPQINIAQYDVGLYLQNTYKVSETIATSFGVRYENQTNLDSKFNFAPRVGIIWAPKAKEKQKPLYTLPRVSIGYGLFYTRFPLFTTLGIRQASDPGRFQYLITEANILNVYPVVPSVDLFQQFALPRTQRYLADEFDNPLQSLLNISASKKLPKGYTLNTTFSRGVIFRQSFTQNINAPLAGTYSLLNPASAVRPFGNTGNIYETQSTGKNQTTRISANLGFPSSDKTYGYLRYSFTKSKSNVVSGSGSPIDPYDFSREFAPTPQDGIHSVSGYIDYKLPRDFSISSDFQISSGGRFNIFTGRDTNGDGYFSERPSFAKNLNKPNLVYTEYGVLDPNPAPGDEIIPRNLGRGPKYVMANMSLTKTFKFGEDKANKKPAKRTLRFYADVDNVFNIINKANPIGNISSPNFLRTISGSTGNFVLSDEGYYYGSSSDSVGRSFRFGLGFSF